jgi:hypothetical protein
MTRDCRGWVYGTIFANPKNVQIKPTLITNNERMLWTCLNNMRMVE